MALGAAMLASTAFTPVARAGEFPPVIALSSLDGKIGFRLDGIDDGDRSGRSVASAGDVNRDGFGDLIIGAYGADPGGRSSAGESYVVFGRSSGFASAIGLSSLDGTTGFRLDGIDTHDDSGRAVASAGDVNGDGFDDLIIGASLADPGGHSRAGETYVIFGKESGFVSATDLSSLDGTTGFRLDGINARDQSGCSVASAGDVNGDGFDDLFVGAYGTDSGGRVNSGASYVVFGKGGGFASAIALSSLDGTAGFRLDGIDARDTSGRSVAAAGDVNGDGFGDLVIGADGAAPGGQTGAGESYVVFGKAGNFKPTIALSGLDGTTGFRLDGVDAYDSSGWSVASAGDVNGDGFGDVIIGANRADPGDRSFAGESYVVFGRNSGFASAIALSSLDGTTGFRLDGINAGDRSGWSVASAGDVNGDGFDDLIVGAPAADPGGRTGAGETHVMFGKSGGFASSVDLSSLDGSNGFRLDGVGSHDSSGESVFSAGDANGDGFDDFVIGASGAGASSAGSTYTVFGRAPDGPVKRVGSAARQSISGGAFIDRLFGAGGNDQLEGRDGADILDGGTGLDTATYAHAAGPVMANLATPSANLGEAAGDRYKDIENLAGSGFADKLYGNGLTNVIHGKDGDDTIDGASGNDVLAGDAGSDALTGGGGPDRFVFSSLAESPVGDGRDTIYDFDPGSQGTSADLIDVSAIDANAAKPGNQAFTWIGTAPFSNTRGQLRIARSGNGTIVSGDVDGDGSADFEIGIKGFPPLAKFDSGDFVK